MACVARIAVGMGVCKPLVVPGQGQSGNTSEALHMKKEKCEGSRCIALAVHQFYLCSLVLGYQHKMMRCPCKIVVLGMRQGCVQ